MKKTISNVARQIATNFDSEIILPKIEELFKIAYEEIKECGYSVVIKLFTFVYSLFHNSCNKLLTSLNTKYRKTLRKACIIVR